MLLEYSDDSIRSSGYRVPSSPKAVTDLGEMICRESFECSDLVELEASQASSAGVRQLITAGDTEGLGKLFYSI